MKIQTWMVAVMAAWIGLYAPSSHACLNKIGYMGSHKNHFSASGKGRSQENWCNSSKYSVPMTYDKRANTPGIYDTRSAKDLSAFWQKNSSKTGCIDTDHISAFVLYQAGLTSSYDLPSKYWDVIPPPQSYTEQEQLAHDGEEHADASEWRTKENNAAVDEIKGGHVQKAIQTLLAIEQREPGHYETATNLGTAYELAGNNQEALKWIEKGIERNPHSHEGSEWLHVLILKSKIQSKGNKEWFENNSIMGLPFLKDGLESKSVLFPLNNDGKKASLNEVMFHTMKQLEERMPLVKPQDPVVSNILYDLAYMAAIHSSLRDGRDILEASQTYGHSKASEARQELGWLQIKYWIQSLKWSHAMSLLLICLFLPFVLYVFFLITAMRQKVAQMVSNAMLRKILFGVYALMMIPASFILHYVVVGIPIDFVSSSTQETHNGMITSLAMLVALIIPLFAFLATKPIHKYYRLQPHKKKKEIVLYGGFALINFLVFAIYPFAIQDKSLDQGLGVWAIGTFVVFWFYLWCLLITIKLPPTIEEPIPEEQA